MNASHTPPVVFAAQRQYIRCPKCDRITQATAVLYEGAPWWAHVHVCECGYTITESEWEPIKVYGIEADGKVES